MAFMKIFRLYCILVFTIGFSGLINAGNRDTRTVISGRIKNFDVYSTTKEFSVEIIDFRGKKTIITDSIKSDGTFKLEFALFVAQDIMIEPFGGRIIAHPGDSIHLNIDFKDIGNIKITGDSYQTNQQLQKYLNSNYSIDGIRSNVSHTLDLMSYKNYCDSVKNDLVNKRINFIKEIKPNAEIKRWTIDNINTQYYTSLLSYPFKYNALNNKNVQPPAEYYNFLDSIGTVFNNVLLNVNVYKLLIVHTATIWNNMIKSHNLDKVSDDSLSIIFIKNINNTVQSDIFKQMIIGNLYYDYLNQNNLSFFENHKEIFKANVRVPFIKIPLENYYEDLKRQAENPKIASDMILKKVNATLGKDILDSILTEHKGKVIYIDCWATWCGPCKAEMPNSKELIKKYAGKDVVFVFVCLDSKEKNWKLDLAQLQLPGSHYFCNTEQSLGIRKGFGIEGIPYYILINKQGQVIESNSLLRPGNSVTQNKIDKLLNTN